MVSARAQRTRSSWSPGRRAWRPGLAATSAQRSGHDSRPGLLGHRARGLAADQPFLTEPAEPDMHAPPVGGTELGIDDDLLQPGGASRHDQPDVAAGRQRCCLREGLMSRAVTCSAVPGAAPLRCSTFVFSLAAPRAAPRARPRPAPRWACSCRGHGRIVIDHARHDARPRSRAGLCLPLPGKSCRSLTRRSCKSRLDSAERIPIDNRLNNDHSLSGCVSGRRRTSFWQRARRASMRAVPNTPLDLPLRRGSRVPDSHRHEEGKDKWLA